MAGIASGDRVTMHYTGKLEDGTEFDSSREREPVDFTAGSAELIPGISEAVIGMLAGEKKTVTVPPERGYGERNEDMRIRVERARLPDDVTVGSVLGLNAGKQQFRAILVELEDDHGILDGNHPLAGKTLVFDLEIVAFGK